MGLIAEIHKDLEKGALQLIVEYRDRLKLEAVKLCGDNASAEDLVFRTFERVLAKADTYKDDINLFAWMKTILENIHRDDKKRPVNRGTEAVASDELERYAGADWSTDEQTLRNSDSEAIREAIAGLDPKYHKVLLMRYYDEFSMKQIAGILRLPLGTVTRRVQIAHRLLAGKLGAILGESKKPLAVILVVLLSLVSAAAVATLPAFEPLRETVSSWFGSDAGQTEDVFAPDDGELGRVGVPPPTEEERQGTQLQETKAEEKQSMKIIPTLIAASTVLSTNIVAAESPAPQPAKTAAVKSAAPVKLAAAAPVLKLNAAPGGTRVWTGATSGDWHTPTNWDPEGVPTADDDIVLAAPEEGSYTVTASQAIEVHSLTVGSDTAGTDCLATFESKTNSVHRIGGNLVVKSGGKLTHTALPASAKTPADECYKLNLQVGGSVTVAAEGTIDVTSRGYASGKGPGYNINAGPSHGGRHATGAATYGSLSSPTNCGSGYGTAGGGVVRIVAEGRITVNGDIVSSADFNNSFCSGAGGSVWLTCSDLQGSGMISVQGGDDYYGSAGSGGRIAVWLTKASGFDWNGRFIAKGGTYRSSSSGGGTGSAPPGTIYLQTAGGNVKTATVIIDNGNLTKFKDVGYVEICAAAGWKNVGKIVVQNNALVKLAQNMRIGDLDMATKNAKINVGTNILTIRYPAHKGGRNWADMFDNHVIKETDPGTGRTGDIVWKGQGFVFFIK